MSRTPTANRVRIIGGEWRSRILRFPPVEGLRPTGDRIRETLFNWLGQDLTGRAVLDLFAGSGALGFEAASRGARHVLMVERDTAVARVLEENRLLLDAAAVEIRRGEAMAFLRTVERRYDAVFLDPPFDAGLLPKVLVALPRHLAPGALVYVEAARLPAFGAAWTQFRRGKAGQVEYALIQQGQPAP